MADGRPAGNRDGPPYGATAHRNLLWPEMTLGATDHQEPLFTPF
jgi:hypothetical protein